jgi:hypothetical protein
MTKNELSKLGSHPQIHSPDDERCGGEIFKNMNHLLSLPVVQKKSGAEVFNAFSPLVSCTTLTRESVKKYE